MGITNNLQNFKADWIDVTLVKIGVFAATLFLAKIWDPILGLDWYWYLIIWMIAAIKPMVTFFNWVKPSGR